MGWRSIIRATAGRLPGSIDVLRGLKWMGSRLRLMLLFCCRAATIA
jgi:hypothetical protein